MMEVKYVYLHNGKGRQLLHIRLVSNTKKYGDTLCGKDFDPEMTAASNLRVLTRKPRGVYECAACLREFRESDHPEAVAYRKAFERV